MVRPATPTDAAGIAPLIILAMDQTAAKFANSDNRQDQLALFEKFVADTGNQYSYTNVLVWDDAGEVKGMILAYDGAEMYQLREPFLQYIRSKLGFTGQPEDETQHGEYYLDCIAVSPAHQGKGIAKELFKALFIRAKQLGHDNIGLLVSKENANAEALYRGLGFEVQNELQILGGLHYHMQRQL